jgi:CRP/FNR family transcriptional regulator
MENNTFQPSPKMLTKLFEYGQQKSFKEGDVILNENAYIKSVPIVISGSMRVMRTDEDGRELLLYYIKSGESCIMSFLGGLHDDTSKVKAIAEEAAEVLFVPVDKVREMIKEFPEWTEYIFRLYHKKFEELLAVINDVAFKKMDERLLDFLKKKCELSGEKNIHITHEQIAIELGSARVVISRLLKHMEDLKLIELGRNKITLL